MLNKALPLLFALASSSFLHAVSPKDLTPALFEASQLFKDYPGLKKTDIAYLSKEGSPRQMYMYAFTSTEAVNPGFTVLLEGSGAQTQHLVINWPVEGDLKAFMAGKRREQLQGFFHILGMDKITEDAAIAVADMAAGKNARSQEVKLGDHGATVYLSPMVDGNIVGLGFAAW